MDVTEATFERDVIEKSHEVPVVVDFWAGWCAPCRALTPVLEKLAAEANGEWVLAKVDVDANPYLSSGFGIQGIPAVKAFRDGRQVAEFTGAQPEAVVRGWLKQLGPSQADELFERGTAAEESGGLEAAVSAYREALASDPGHDRARAALARVELLQRSGALDGEELRARLERDPADVDAVIGLADLDAARGRLDEAFRRLIEFVRYASGDERERARRHLLGLLDTIPPDDPRAMIARRALSLALF